MSNKRQLDRAGLDELLAEAGVGPAASSEELTEGTFNTVYRIGRPDGDLILKLSPDPDAPGLTYEQDLIHTEAEFYRAALGKAPVPEVVHEGEDYLLMTALPGTTLQSAGAGAGVRGELGGIVASLHEVTGTGFGYPQKGLVQRWSEAFLSMVDDVLGDAERYAVRLPRPAEQIWQAALDRKDLLDDVRTPRLIHFDLWDGNVLVEDGRITGLVDGERAFWGDPVAEFVSLSLLSGLDDELLAGYGADVDREKLSLYRVYLYLIMLVEGTPRGYTGARHEGLVKLVESHLLTELGALEQGS
ncbi:phosphotransferase family enzyme [Kribbella orskensis]|uniref:Phosphotransferase family enzyme n=1 Tax=Kribbella orskensis TaxID=2512216 RepID=A0ABY2BCX8_9ACTN|nr:MULTISPECIES: aminoglycoside phosphotransferase family protein [Kribbella]TCN35034.1 phosphotransferase family enzyme [Kribbella sp. VKM Ac-2500]TCO16401.1 phosphotransferase family enzyme [Kribbella orskensis]